MRSTSLLRSLAAGLALGASALLIFGAAAPTAEGDDAHLIENGQAGFVVSYFAYALSGPAAETGACPQGLSRSYRDIFIESPEGQRREGESDLDLARRVARGGRGLIINADGQSLCLNPELGGPDPYFRTVTGRNVPARGIDVDGQDSRANGRPAPGTCAHDDFRGFNGERGIDNQFLRVVGCTNKYQAGETTDGMMLEMLSGSWGILMTVSGIDDIRNDDNVEVGFYANADPIQVVSGTRQAIQNVTYAMDRDPRFRATTRGRIVNGVLTSDPVDVRFHYVIVALRLERPLLDARVHMTFTADGGLEGILAGYAPVDALYDVTYGLRTATDASGQISPARAQANGFPDTVGSTCHGAYQALQQAADGHRDPTTGRCTAISTQFEIRATPAFVVDAPTQSLNADIAR